MASSSHTANTPSETTRTPVAAISCLLPDSRVFNYDLIQAWCPSKQNLRKGQSLVSEGCVRGISGERRGVLTCFIESEKSANWNYKVTFSYDNTKKTWSTTWVCIANKTQSFCKHQVAFCFALVALRDHWSSEAFPKKFELVGLGKFQIPKNKNSLLRDNIFYREAELDLSWPDITDRMLVPIPTYHITAAGKKRKTKTQEKSTEEVKRVKRGKREKLYCHCQTKFEKGKRMVERSGKALACRNSWYHISCVEILENITCERGQGGTIVGEYFCTFCQASRNIKAK